MLYPKLRSAYVILLLILTRCITIRMFSVNSLASCIVITLVNKSSIMYNLVGFLMNLTIAHFSIISILLLIVARSLGKMFMNNSKKYLLCSTS